MCECVLVCELRAPMTTRVRVWVWVCAPLDLGCLLEVGRHEGQGAARTRTALVLFLSILWIEPYLVVLVLFGFYTQVPVP